jgi:NAD(P)-dependent dehydrogenase (short-subunit alcohol dehydrogenase family)
VNVVNPGPVITERLQEGLLAEARLLGISLEEALARSRARQPLGRLAEPREIADAVLFLASPRASYVTGAVLAMDGAAVPVA